MYAYRAAAGLLLSCSVTLAAGLPAAPTFYKDVAPILHSHCVNCHRPGEIAPMPLITYEQVRPWAAAIKEAVLIRKMPPWFADAPAGHFSNDWRLSEEQIDVIRRWTQAHAPAGDPNDAPPAEKFSEGWQNGRPDMVLRIPHEERIPGAGEDVWKVIMFDHEFQQDTWIRGLEIRPGNRKVVHHANIHVITPIGDGPVDWSKVPEDMDAPRNKGSAVKGFHAVAIHVGLPGRFSFETQPGSAVMIPKGSRLRINIHYAPARTPETDLTQLGLYFADGRLDKEWKDLHCKIRDFRIPARASASEVRGTNKVTQPITVYQVGAHMHLRGKSYRIEARLPDGKNLELLNVPKWDFNWQLMYTLARPVHLPAGTVISYIATYDNSAANPLVLKYDTPDRDVFDGERTIDEMMGGYVMHTVDSEHLSLDINRQTGVARTNAATASR
jgi:hypothetical protein